LGEGVFTKGSPPIFHRKRASFKEREKKKKNILGPETVGKKK